MIAERSMLLVTVRLPVTSQHCTWFDNARVF